MNKIHPEFAYQSRELRIQIEDTLGEPPNRVNYERVIQSLINEYANGSGIADVNMLSFALADYLRFDDAAGILAQGTEYDEGDSAKILKMVSCNDAEARKALDAVFDNDPDLARKAIITAFLYKNPKRWTDEDHSLDALQKDEDDEQDEDEDQMQQGQDIEHLFDSRGDENV